MSEIMKKYWSRPLEYLDVKVGLLTPEVGLFDCVGLLIPEVGLFDCVFPTYILTG